MWVTAQAVSEQVLKLDTRTGGIRYEILFFDDALDFLGRDTARWERSIGLAVGEVSAALLQGVDDSDADEQG